MDRATEALVEQAPLYARIGEALERGCSTLPPEVAAYIESLGSRVVGARLLKISFHATFLIDVDPALVAGETVHFRAIVQVVGVTLGDKAFWGQLTGANLQRAHELAAEAGVRVPIVFGLGSASVPDLGLLDFVVEEFVETQTVEDEVKAPREQWRDIHSSAVGALASRPIPDAAAAAPLMYFKDVDTHLVWLLQHVPDWDTELRSALTLFAHQVMENPPPPRPPVLLHQDLNCGNMLCSERPLGSGCWSLDALIDWESAVVADPRSLSPEEPFRTARLFAFVVKGAELAERYVRGTMPRCELEQLIEGYTNGARGLSEARLLRFVTWADRVHCARAAMANKG